MHHPQRQLVLHIIALLLRLIIRQRIQPPPVGIGMVPAAILVNKVGVVVVVGVVVLGQLGRVGGRDVGVEGGVGWGEGGGGRGRWEVGHGADAGAEVVDGG